MSRKGLIALTRDVSPSITECALSYLDREVIDVELARRQHEAYRDCLRVLGVEILSLSPEPDLPDAVFVEDTTVVVDEMAVMTRPLLPARQAEVASVAATLERFRPVRWVEMAATLEGGDVLRIGRSVYVGLSARSNGAGIEQLASYLEPCGYRVQPVSFKGCLHLKSACTFIGHGTVLANPAWVDTTQFDGCEVVEVDPSEPCAGNALLIGDTVILPASFPKTQELLTQRGFRVNGVDVSELQKAEAGVTCCSILLEGNAG